MSAPAFASSRIRIGDHELRIDTDGFRRPVVGGPPQYVQAVAVDDQPMRRTWLDGRELRRASRLVISLGDEPSEWGRNDRPPSGHSAPTRNVESLGI